MIQKNQNSYNLMNQLRMCIEHSQSHFSSTKSYQYESFYMEVSKEEWANSTNYSMIA